MDGPGGGVLAKQRALRAAQHFDMFDIDKIERRRCWPRMINLVDIEADAGLQTIVGLTDADDTAAKAANGDGRVARIGRAIGQAGHQQAELPCVDRVTAFDQVAINNRNGCRHSLRIFKTAARGDQDFGYTPDAIACDFGADRAVWDPHRDQQRGSDNQIHTPLRLTSRAWIQRDWAAGQPLSRTVHSPPAWPAGSGPARRHQALKMRGVSQIRDPGSGGVEGGLRACEALVQEATTFADLRRRMVAPIRPKPAISMAQLAGSGTALGSPIPGRLVTPPSRTWRTS